MNVLTVIGRGVVRRASVTSRIAGVCWAALVRASRRSTWTEPTRNVLARQILFTGIEASRFVSLIALLVGLSIVVQVQLFVTRFGQSALLGPVLVAVVVRELGPLLTHFVIIGRSGAAMVTELGNMKVHGEVEVLEAQGIDPFDYLVVPRVVGMLVSIFCLTVLFISVALLGGFFSGTLLGSTAGAPGTFLNSVMAALAPGDILVLAAKILLPALATAAICCHEGLRVGRDVTEVPQAATRALVRSVGALFVLSALISLLYVVS
jgi:phospholipid/cholesterol/gamma-HCH transport system permease protein